MKFNYQARTKEGKPSIGSVEASSKDAALAVLQKNNLYVTFLEEGKKPIYGKEIKIFRRVKKKEIVVFSRQLSVMFKSKIPLIEALNTLVAQSTSEVLKEKIIGLSKEVEGGSSLSEAMSKYPKVFSDFYVWMVKTGEASGKLSDSLSYLADHLERDYEFSEKLRGALIYPAFIVFIIVMVLLLVIFFVIPQMTSVLEGIGTDQLPATTRFIMSLPSFLKTWGWIFLVILGGSIFFGRKYYKTPEGKEFFDSFLIKMILIGPFLRLVYLTRFSENFATLISAGLPISQSLEIVGNIVGNTPYRKAIFETREGIRKGETISSVLNEYPKLFPPLILQMISVGEKTGNLGETLMQVSTFYQKETDRGITNLLSILEPVLIVFLGGVVGGMIAAILLPMYQSLSF